MLHVSKVSVIQRSTCNSIVTHNTRIWVCYHDDITLQVFFIDYGNSEDLKTKDIVTCTPHLDVPPFAIATTTNDMENVSANYNLNRVL